MTYLVDTDWAAEYLSGYRRAVTLLTTLQPQGIAISYPTYGELYEGIYTGADPRGQEHGFQQFLRVVPILPMTRLILRRFARIRGELRQAGNLIGDMDLLIAATALHHGLILVTRNRRHFDRVPGLTLHP
jgi:tRNA(fMet)-specific endonuclease VapC